MTKGCIPTKVMVTAADVIRNSEEVHKIGIQSQKMKIDWDVLSKRVWQKIDESKEIVEEYKKEKNLDVYQGRAFFVRDKVLKVEYNEGGVSEEITAEISCWQPEQEVDEYP
ncbi:Mycothione reductase [Fusobacterium necrophorum subsp. necrophorum]|nr:Mycothione reductase [Fusobacterium necrophorum subsp. necrophorum]